MSDVHVDYKTQMDQAEEIKFSDLYENAIVNIEKNYRLPEDLIKELKKKRDFGLEKYGEYSFQSTMKNALSTPTLTHLKEEIIDSFNYIDHEVYKQKLLANEENDASFNEIIVCLKRIWNTVNCIEHG